MKVLDTLFRVVNQIEAIILAYTIMLIALVTIANVITRTAFNWSLTFAEELAQFCIVSVTFIGLSYAASQDRHIRMSALHDLFHGVTRKLLMLLTSGATAAAMFLMCYYSVRYVSSVQSLGTVSPALRVPVALVYYTVPVGFAFAGIQYALTFVRNCAERETRASFADLEQHKDR